MKAGKERKANKQRKGKGRHPDKQHAATLSANPSFQEDKYVELFRHWRAAVGEETITELAISEQTMRDTCRAICKHFPRGSGCGCLLLEPIVDDTPLEQRGVSMQWMRKASLWMRDMKCPIPTRLFVALFVEPLVDGHHQQQSKSQDSIPQREEVIPLYYFIPPEFRGPPQIFMSHGWDSWLWQLFFLPKNSLLNSHNTTHMWVDIFAIVQDPGSVKQKAEVARIGEVVRSIGKTCLVVPGHGSLHFALLPARRSWCCFEIAYTQFLLARVGENEGETTRKQDNENTRSYHNRLIQEIKDLKCAKATTGSQIEKKTIQDLLDDMLGLDEADRMIQRALLKSFYERYTVSRVVGVAALYKDALDACV